MTIRDLIKYKITVDYENKYIWYSIKSSTYSISLYKNNNENLIRREGKYDLYVASEFKTLKHKKFLENKLK